MSCILCSPKACARLAARILAHEPEAKACAKLVGFAWQPDALAEQLYLANVQAFQVEYQGRHQDRIQSITDVPPPPALVDVESWTLLAKGLEFFTFQLESDDASRASYLFLRRLLDTALSQSTPEQLARLHDYWSIP